MGEYLDAAPHSEGRLFASLAASGGLRGLRLFSWTRATKSYFQVHFFGSRHFVRARNSVVQRPAKINVNVPGSGTVDCGCSPAFNASGEAGIGGSPRSKNV